MTVALAERLPKNKDRYSPEYLGELKGKVETLKAVVTAAREATNDATVRNQLGILNNYLIKQIHEIPKTHVPKVTGPYSTNQKDSLVTLGLYQLHEMLPAQESALKGKVSLTVPLENGQGAQDVFEATRLLLQHTIADFGSSLEQERQAGKIRAAASCAAR